MAFAALVPTAAFAAAPPSGNYTGTSDAYNGATMAFTIDASGHLSDVASESYCFDGWYQWPVQWTGAPDIPVQAGVSFSTTWEVDESIRYEFAGRVNADGTASGTGRASFLPSGTCGGVEFSWSASTPYTPPPPAPTYDPQASVSPTSLTESELVSDGVTVSGTDFAPGSSVTLTVDGETVTSRDANSSGNVSFGYTWALAPGSHEATLSSADGADSASFTVTADPVVYDPQATVSPTSLTESELTSDGVTVSGTGFAPGSSVTLTVDGETVTSRDADSNGDVSFGYTWALAPGSHEASLSSADGSDSASFTVTVDPVVYDPQTSVSPSSLGETEMQTDGVLIQGEGFAPGSFVALTVGGQGFGGAEADENGRVSFDVTSQLEPGTYDVLLTADEGTATATLTITSDAPEYHPNVGIASTSFSQWQYDRTGLLISLSGFPAEADLDVVLDGEVVGTVTTDQYGEVTGDIDGYFTRITPEAGVGDHTLTFRADDAEGSVEFEVLSDEDYYDGVVADPSIEADPSEVTESELESAPIAVEANGFPENDLIDVVVDGEVVATIDSGAEGEIAYELAGPLTVGDHVITARHPVGEASTTVTVLSDAPAPTYDPSASVEPGSLTESEAADTGVTISGEGFAPGSEVTLSVAGSDVETLAADAAGAVSFTYVGALAPGEVAVVLSAAEGSAEASFTVMADPAPPAPTYDPSASVEPGSLTESEAADSGVTISGEGFAPASEVTLSVAGSVVETVAADAAGAVSFTYVGVLAPGEVAVVLSAAEGSAEASFTVTEDPAPPAPTYDPSASVEPGSLTESEAADTGVTISGEGFAPASEVTLSVAGSVVETLAADAAGAVSFVFAGVLAPGEVAVVLSAAEGSAEASFEVTADPAPPAPADPTEDDLDPALEDGITVPAEAAPGETITVTIPSAEEGDEVEIWLFSTPTSLGVHAVDAAGTVSVTIPLDAELGDHRIGAWTTAGDQIGWAGIVLAQDAGTGDPEPGDADDSDADDPGQAETGQGGADDADQADGLAVTGGSGSGAMALWSALLLLVGGALVGLRRRHRMV